MNNEIREIRAMTNLSRQKFAERYNIPTKTIEKWEQGERKPPRYVVDLLLFKVEHDMKEFNQWNDIEY